MGMLVALLETHFSEESVTKEKKLYVIETTSWVASCFSGKIVFGKLFSVVCVVDGVTRNVVLNVCAVFANFTKLFYSLLHLRLTKLDRLFPLASLFKLTQFIRLTKKGKTVYFIILQSQWQKRFIKLTPVANFMKWFSLSLIVQKNKLECLSYWSHFSSLYNLQARPGLGHRKVLQLGGLCPCLQILD